MHDLRKTAPRPGSPAPLQPSWTTRQISRLLIGLLVIPLGGTATSLAQQAPPPTAPPNQRAPQMPSPATEVASSSVASSSLLPVDGSGEAAPDAPAPQNAPAQQQQTNPPQQQPSAPQQPLGTAAAPYEQPNGITASRPAGAAIAPAKQKRTRTLVIRVGVLIAAAAAIGTVVALSSASPSTPH